MSKPGLSATDIGRRFGASAQEVNRLLKEQGFLQGSPGQYGLTPKGQEYGIEEHYHRGTGGYAHMNRYWEQRYWDESIFDQLDIDKSVLAKVRATMAEEKITKRAESLTGQGQFNALPSQEQIPMRESAGHNQRNTHEALLLAIAALSLAGLGYASYKVYPSLKLAWQRFSERKQATEETVVDHDGNHPKS